MLARSLDWEISGVVPLFDLLDIGYLFSGKGGFLASLV